MTIPSTAAAASQLVLPSRPASPAATLLSRVRAQTQPATRPLLPREVDELLALGNELAPAPLVAAGMPAGALGGGRVRGCAFRGKCVVGGVPRLLERVVMEDCVVLGEAVEVRDTLIMRRVMLGAGAVVVGCGVVAGPPGGGTTTFGNGTVVVSPGVETGGRATPCVMDMDFEMAARVAYDRSAHGQALFRDAVQHVAARYESLYTVIAPNARCIMAASVESTYVGENAEVSFGARVWQSCLGEGVRVTGGSDVRNSLLQQGTVVELQSVVRDSFLCQGSHVEIHGKVLSSILGPGSSVAEGEVTSSLMGPLVGFHHQALLIAAYWPTGRGNVGYGANVGSNHTSRLSDQSLWPGEGVFFGLGSSSKFPLNLSEAPYTIVATGVVWGPGRLSLPFSLITEGGRVAPGWGIVSNAYQLERAFVKGKSRAPPGYAAQPLRASVMNLVWLALRRLRAVRANSLQQQRYTEADGLSLAGGFVTAGDMDKGIRAYEFVLELYALRTVVETFGPSNVAEAMVRSQGVSEATAGRVLGAFDPADTGMEVKDVDMVKEHACLMMHETVLRRRRDVITPDELLSQYVDHETTWAKWVRESKARDHERGAAVFPVGKYDEGVVDLDKDVVVVSARQRAAVAGEARGGRGAALL